MRLNASSLRRSGLWVIQRVMSARYPLPSPTALRSKRIFAPGRDVGIIEVDSVGSGEEEEVGIDRDNMMIRKPSSQNTQTTRWRFVLSSTSWPGSEGP